MRLPGISFVCLAVATCGGYIAHYTPSDICPVSRSLAAPTNATWDEQDPGRSTVSIPSFSERTTSTYFTHDVRTYMDRDLDLERRASSSPHLFDYGGSVSAKQVFQARGANCWLSAAMLMIAMKDPSVIKETVKDYGSKSGKAGVWLVIEGRERRLAFQAPGGRKTRLQAERLEQVISWKDNVQRAPRWWSAKLPSITWRRKQRAW